MKTLKFLLKNERGQVMIIAIVLLVIGALLITPLLSFISTGVKTGQLIAKKTDELYAADAGVEDAIWQIINQTEGIVPPPTEDPDVYPYGTLYTITNIDDTGIDVDVQIQRMDIPIPEYGLIRNYYGIQAMAKNPDGSQVTVVSKVYATWVENFGVFSGALVASGDIDLDRLSTVEGNIMCGGDFSANEPFSYTSDPPGSEPQEFVDDLTFPSDAENLIFANKYKAEASDETNGGGTHEGDLIIPQDNKPFDYEMPGPLYITGDFKVGKNANVIMDGTIYVKGNIDVDLDAQFTGSGNIIAEGNIYMSKLPQFGLDANPVIFSLNGSITFKKEVGTEADPLHALIYAPNGDINFDKTAYIDGAVVCGGAVVLSDITIDKELHLTYDDFWEQTMELPGSTEGTIRTLEWSINPQ